MSALGKPSIVCDDAVCEDQAFVDVFWPGQTRSFCIIHALRAQTVAEAMGLKLDARPIEFDRLFPDVEASS